jgi:hypothetical protein
MKWDVRSLSVACLQSPAKITILELVPAALARRGNEAKEF